LRYGNTTCEMNDCPVVLEVPNREPECEPHDSWLCRRAAASDIWCVKLLLGTRELGMVEGVTRSLNAVPIPSEPGTGGVVEHDALT
jgi:hypothetical protein